MTAEHARPQDLRVVCLDAANTLLQATPPVAERYAATAAAHGVRVEPAAIVQAFRDLWPAQRARRARLLHGADEAATFAFWLDVIGQIFAPWRSQFADFEAFARQLYLDFASPAAWRPFDDVLPCLEQLARRGLRLALVSNWDRHLRPILQGLGLEDRFDHIAISAELGVEKPAPAIFAPVLRALAVEPAQVVHVGDTRSEDVVGARAAGLWAVHLRRHAPPSAEAPAFVDGIASVRSLDALVELLAPQRN